MFDCILRYEEELSCFCLNFMNMRNTRPDLL